VIRLGRVALRALYTPGHTLESTSYLVGERWLFTGDTLFLAAVGRPDLEASREEAQKRALMLHASLRRLFSLDPSLLVLPAHTSEPIAFDGRLVAAQLSTVREKVRLRDQPEAFAEYVLSRIPATPPNHHTIVALNEAGEMPAGDPTDLEAGANRCAVS
jgi:glyoxylase-like metal-dependent hydrolase (beta-lactamase superfamily II)